MSSEIEEGLDRPGLELLALCVQSNVDMATHMHNSIVEGLEREVVELRERLEAIYAREDRAWARLRWLMGHDLDEDNP